VSRAGRLSDREVLALRGPKTILDPVVAHAAILEQERDASGALVPTAVIFLTNRECPFRCVMCDLWVNTLDDSVAEGVIPAQIRAALAHLPGARQVKLYNAGSFFDAQAIPPADDEEIARVVSGFERVVIEAHPVYLRGPYGERCLRFRDALADRSSPSGVGRDRGGTRLEVAIVLETANPPVLERLNKHMTVEDFSRAAGFLREHDVDVRCFILLQPPFMRADEAVEWGCRSIDAAFDAGASVCSIIPTRGGNGAMEAIGEAYRPPRLRSLEAAVEYGLSLNAFRVYADLWGVEKFFDCGCSAARAARLAWMNQTQQISAAIACPDCAG